MKYATDPRHLKRAAIVKLLFSVPFLKKNFSTGSIVAPILKHRRAIDNLIAKAAPEWSVTKINRIDLAILRLAAWEIAFDKKNPPKVIIDEAVELAKTYGAEGSPAFVNGALGALLKNKKKQ